MHSHHNGLKTAALLGLLTAMILAVGYWLGGSAGLVFAVAPLAGDERRQLLLLRQARAALDAGAAGQRGRVPRAVRRSCVSWRPTAGQPMPRLYVSPSMQPNAFATGRNPQHAAVAVTDGITRILDRARAARRDRPRAVPRLQPGHPDLERRRRRWPASSRCSPSWRSSCRSAARTTTTARIRRRCCSMLILGPLAASVIQLAISRNREFQADASGATLTRDPLALASALREDPVRRPARCRCRPRAS